MLGGVIDSARKLTLAVTVAFALGMALAPLVIKLAKKLKAGQVVLEGHISHCVRSGFEKGNPDDAIAEFTKAVEYFSRMG